MRVPLLCTRLGRAALAVIAALVLADLRATAFFWATTQESFDTGSKLDYPAAPVALPTGTWLFTDALLGSSTQDRKNGAQAARLQQQGRLTMDFFLPDGAATVTVQHALFGADGTSAWELWMQKQDCGCDKWTKVGQTIITTRSALQAATFTVNEPGAVRFEIRKVSGGAARLNIDDVAVVSYSTVTPPPPPPPAAADNDHMALGNPSGATADPAMFTNYLMRKPQYALSYHRDRGTPNWVSWHLDQSDRGSAARQDDFRADPTLPAGWYQVQGSSYSGSGFDRGHNCPSADRTSSVENNSATFLMTNMIPQAPNNNQGTWNDLEGYTRTFLPGNEMYIIMGSYGQGGTGRNGFATTLDGGRVTVPSRVWKVIVILPVGDNDISRVDANTRIIAIDTPNNENLSRNWGQYRVSVDAIEAATGYDLLSALPVAVQDVVEAKIDNGPTQ